MVSRPDGGIFFSDDDGVSWRESGQIVPPPSPPQAGGGDGKAPRLFVLADGTLSVLQPTKVGYMFS